MSDPGFLEPHESSPSIMAKILALYLENKYFILHWSKHTEI